MAARIICSALTLWQGKCQRYVECPDYTIGCASMKLFGLLGSCPLVKAGVQYTQGKEETMGQGHRYFKISGEKKKVILWCCEILQKSLSSDNHSTSSDSSLLQCCFMANSNKLKSHTSIYCVLNLLIWDTHLPVYNVQEGRTERTFRLENLMLNFLSGRFCSPFCFLAFSLATASCTTRGFQKIYFK